MVRTMHLSINGVRTTGRRAIRATDTWATDHLGDRRLGDRYRLVRKNEKVKKYIASDF